VKFDIFDEDKMNFGPADMAQMMDGARALLAFAMGSSVGIGIVLGIMTAVFFACFQTGMHRKQIEPWLTNKQLLSADSSSQPSAGWPVSEQDQVLKELTLINTDMKADNRPTSSGAQILFIKLSIVLVIVVVGGGCFYLRLSRTDRTRRESQTFR
jgi:hypothetical protein